MIDPLAIKKAVAARRDDLRQLVQALVSIPSENTPPTGREREAQEFLSDYARCAGLNATLYSVDGLADLEKHPTHRSGTPPRTYAGRPNLIVRYDQDKSAPGNDSPRAGRSLLFTGHVDTVPAGTKGWTRPPFSGVEEDGRIYGRGAYDMKGGLACGLMALHVLRDLDVKLLGDVGFESVVDEEFCGGNGTLAGRVRGDHYDGAVILEPTNLNIYNAHRGLRIAEVSVIGRAGVSFAGEKLANPVEKIGSIVDWFNSFGRARNRESAGRAGNGYETYAEPVPYMITRVTAGADGSDKVLAVPQAASIEFFWETLPGETREEVDRAFFGGLEEWASGQPDISRESVSVVFPYEWMPGSAVPADHPLVQRLRGAVRISTGAEPKVLGAPYPCDGYLFNLHSPTTAVLFGPRGGNAHSADEFVRVEDLATVVESLCLLAADWCGTAE